ncbi:MAG: energy transducer TonB [Gammaproteobacteria bacterium]
MQANALTQFRILPTFGAGAAFTIAIFWLLYSVIHATGHGVDKSELLPTIDFVRLKRDSQVETLERRKPPPPPPEVPPPPAKMKIASTETTQQQAPTPFAMPNLGLSASVGGGPFVGSMGGGGAPSIGGMFDGDIIPLQRISPQYPRDAARARITGWVQLEVLVNADGSVRSARVLEAQPKGLFEAAAVAAVLKWKFKPKVVNGQSVAQRGAQRIEFNLVQS